jgi:thiol-disulfide isomerase/thioredoxin
MFLFSLLGLLMLPLTAASGQSTPSEAASGVATSSQTTLQWQTGDRLAGQLVSADAQTLTFNAPLFTQPLHLRQEALSSITFPTVPEESTANTDVFRVLLRNGDMFYGSLASLTDDTLTLESARTGQTQIQRSEVRMLQRLQLSNGVVFNGPLGLRGWQGAMRRSSDEERQLQQMRQIRMQNVADQNQQDAARQDANAGTDRWTANPDGAISTSRQDAGLFLPLVLPQKIQIEVQLSFRNRPDFLMSLGRDGRRGLRLESWSDSLVLAHAERFTPLMTLDGKEQTLHLQWFVDIPSRKASVHLASGEKLGELVLEEQTAGNPGGFDESSQTPEILEASQQGRFGLLFRNGSSSLTIRRLRISEWNGQAPQEITGSGTRVETLNGEVLFGDLRPHSTQADLLTVQAGEKSRDLNLRELGAIIFPSEQQTTTPGKIQLSWPDGAAISGSLISVRDGQAELQTSWATTPVLCRIDALSAMTFPRSEAPAPATDDRLLHAHGVLQGQVSFDGPATTPLRWLATGASQSVAFQPGSNARILRGTTVVHFSETPDLLKGYPDVLYLTSNDVLPCRIDTWDEQGVRFTSPLASVTTLPATSLRAVELGVVDRIHQRDFSSPEWQGRVARSEDKKSLRFRGNVSYVHPSILTGDTVRFQMQWPPQCYGHMMISLYGGSGRSESTATPVVFSIMENSLQVHDQPISPRQQQGFFGFNMQNQKDVVRVPQRKATVQLIIRDGKVLVSVNDQEVRSIRLNAAGAQKRSVGFHSNVSAAGQTVVDGRVQEGAGIEVSGFEIDNLAGGSIRQFIEEEVRQTTLTIPRFRRNNPPTHALIATNGDVLRGNLLSLTAEDVQFESRLEPLRISRSRLAAIVRLEAPQPASTTETTDDGDGFITGPDEPSALPVQLTLADGYRITATPAGLDSDFLTCSSAELGQLRLPPATIREIRIGNPEDTPVAIAFQKWIAQPAKEPDWDIPQSDGGNSEAASLIGSTAPDFQLTQLDGGTFRLSDHQDKVIILDFWATWCGPCVAALPEYLSAVSKFDSSKVLFIAVNQQESADQIRNFLEARQLTANVTLDTDGSAGQKYRVSGIPHTVVIGPGHVVEDVHVGYRPGSAEELQTTIQDILKGTWVRPNSKSDGTPATSPESSAPKEPADSSSTPAETPPLKD